MTAFGRLWRRAPAWRFTLFSAIGCGALAAMFPPGIPTLHWPSHATPAGPHFAQQAPQQASDGLFAMPPPGDAKTGSTPFAGRILPLPPGSWLQVAIATLPNGVQQKVLARINGNHLDGLVLASATGVFGGPAGPVGVPPQCADPSRLAGAIVPAAPGDNPLQHECWALVPADMKQLASPDGNPALSRALGRLGDTGVLVPDKMLATQFVRSTDHGWQTTLVLLPDKGGTITAQSKWAARYQEQLHAGFDGA